MVSLAFEDRGLAKPFELGFGIQAGSSFSYSQSLNMIASLFRDTFAGLLIYRLSGRRLLQHPEERPDFQIPDRYRRDGKHGTRAKQIKGKIQSQERRQHGKEEGQQNQPRDEEADASSSSETVVEDDPGRSPDMVDWYDGSTVYMYTC